MRKNLKFIYLKTIIILFIMLFIPFILNAGEITQLIDIPTAAVVRKGNFELNTRLYTEGGVLVRSDIGLAQRFNLGLSYGGTKIISEENPEFNNMVGIDAKYRLSDGDMDFPSIAIGYDGQGYGAYNKTDERYRNKSKGLYLVMSKEIKSVGGLHIGTNYSFENKDDKNGSIFLGIIRNLGPEIMAIVDYDLALNDDNDKGVEKNEQTYKAYGEGKGYLNAGLRWLITPELYLEFDFLNLTQNLKDVKKGKEDDDPSRIIKISYTNYFDFKEESHGK